MFLFIVLFLTIYYYCIFFFFQAEDGIRDRDVTGVQTCALPICLDHDYVAGRIARPAPEELAPGHLLRQVEERQARERDAHADHAPAQLCQRPERRVDVVRRLPFDEASGEGPDGSERRGWVVAATAAGRGDDSNGDRAHPAVNPVLFRRIDAGKARLFADDR